MKVNLHDGWAEMANKRSEDKDSDQGDDNENWPEKDVWKRDTEKEELDMT